MIQIIENWKPQNLQSIVDLYNSVGWNNYTKNPDSLLKALENSPYIAVAMDGEELVGLVRSISDDVSIHYLQDILIRPSHQDQGIGRKLIQAALKRFSHVRAHVLLTDDEEKQMKFYQSAGFDNIKEFREGTMNAFIKIK